MALQTKIQFKSIDKAGVLIQLIDATGAYSSDNPNGYGLPNNSYGDFNKIVLKLSQYSTSVVYTQTYVRVADPSHPEWLTSPTLNKIMAGTPMELNSMSLSQSVVMFPFQDGVFNVDMYNVISIAKTGVVATPGANYIIGSGLDDYLGFDSVQIADLFYDIDKTKNTNGGTVLYLVQEITVEDDQFYPVYRANAKFITDSSTKECLYNKVGKLSSCTGKNQPQLVDMLSEIDQYKWAAQYAFDNGDFIQANALIISAQKLCTESNCRC